MHRGTGFSGADVASLVREASLHALKQAQDSWIQQKGGEQGNAQAIIEETVIDITVSTGCVDTVVPTLVLLDRYPDRGPLPLPALSSHAACPIPPPLPP
jgi:hypothetical protein